MNIDLISREALLKEVESRIMWSMSYNAIYEAIQIAPAVDAVEVVHGQWGLTDDRNAEMTCSECGFTYYGERDEECMSPYCPDCGAKMDGERKE